MELLCSVHRRLIAAVLPVFLLSVLFTNGNAQELPRIPKSLAQLKEIQKRVKEVTAKLRKATVGVRVGRAQGSGVIINKLGMVLTAAHVAGRNNLNVVLIMPDGTQVRGKTLGLNRSMDAALIKIVNDEDEDSPKKKEWPFMPMAKKSAKAGDWCIAIGHPGGFRRERPAVLRLGKVISMHANAVVTDCTLVGGDSGGPLANLNGEIIAIHSRIGASLKANMHVPIKAFKDDWNRLASGEMWGHLPGRPPYIGVKGMGGDNGAKVQEVVPNSPAARAGLKVDDVVMQFGNKKVDNFDALFDLVQETAPGDKIKLIVERDKKKIEIQLTIGRAPRRRRNN